DLAPERPDVRQRLDEDGGLLVGSQLVHHDVRMFSSMYAWLRSLVRIIASPRPRPRSHTISIVRAPIASLSIAVSCSAATPSRHTTTPPYAIDTESGSNSTPAVPSSL